MSRKKRMADCGHLGWCEGTLPYHPWNTSRFAFKHASDEKSPSSLRGFLDAASAREKSMQRVFTRRRLAITRTRARLQISSSSLSLSEMLRTRNLCCDFLHSRRYPIAIETWRFRNSVRKYYPWRKTRSSESHESLGLTFQEISSVLHTYINSVVFYFLFSLFVGIDILKYISKRTSELRARIRTGDQA